MIIDFVPIRVSVVPNRLLVWIWSNADHQLLSFKKVITVKISTKPLYVVWCCIIGVLYHGLLTMPNHILLQYGNLNNKIWS